MGSFYWQTELWLELPLPVFLPFFLNRKVQLKKTKKKKIFQPCTVAAPTWHATFFDMLFVQGRIRTPSPNRDYDRVARSWDIIVALSLTTSSWYSSTVPPGFTSKIFNCLHGERILLFCGRQSPTAASCNAVARQLHIACIPLPVLASLHFSLFFVFYYCPCRQTAVAVTAIAVRLVCQLIIRFWRLVK